MSTPDLLAAVQDAQTARDDELSAAYLEGVTRPDAGLDGAIEIVPDPTPVRGLYSRFLAWLEPQDEAADDARCTAFLEDGDLR